MRIKITHNGVRYWICGKQKIRESDLINFFREDFGDLERFFELVWLPKNHIDVQEAHRRLYMDASPELIDSEHAMIIKLYGRVVEFNQKPQPLQAVTTDQQLSKVG